MTWTTSTPVVGEQLVEVVIGARDTEARGALRAAFIAGTEQAADLDADTAQPFDVDGADEAAADHGRANIAQRASSQTLLLVARAGERATPEW